MDHPLLWQKLKARINWRYIGVGALGLVLVVTPILVLDVVFLPLVVCLVLAAYSVYQRGQIDHWKRELRREKSVHTFQAVDLNAWCRRMTRTLSEQEWADFKFEKADEKVELTETLAPEIEVSSMAAVEAPKPKTRERTRKTKTPISPKTVDALPDP